MNALLWLNWLRRRRGGGGYPIVQRLTISGTGFMFNGQAWVPYGMSDGHFELTRTGDEALDAAMGATALRTVVRTYGTYGTGYQQDMQEEGQPGNLKPAYLAEIVRRLTAARAAGMRNGIANDSNKGQGAEASGGNDFFGGLTEGNRQKALFIGTAVYLAQNYGDLIDWMEPLVEPNSAVVASAAVLQAFQEEFMTAILAVAPHMLFPIGPRDYSAGNIANAIKAAWLVPGNAFYGKVFSTCNFLDNLSMDEAQRVSRAASVAAARDADGVPCWINQIATHNSNDPTNVNLDATMTLHDENDIGYSYWERVSMAGTADGLRYLSDTGDPDSARLSHDERISVVQAHFTGVPYWMTAPVITGDPTEGELVTYTIGTAAGRPVPTLTARVRVNNVDKGDAASYTIQAGDVGLPVVIRQTATNTAGAVSSDSDPVDAVAAGETLLETGRIGGQIAQLIDFTADAITCDLMKRARNFAQPIGSPYQYTEATCLLRIASLTRSSNVTTVVLSEAPASYQGDANIRTGFRLVLTCPADPTFDADHVAITVTDQTHFTYPNTAANASYTAVNRYDVPASTVHSVAVGASGHPIEDFFTMISTVSGSAASNDDLNGTYLGVYPGTPPNDMTVSGGALSGWTSGGADTTFTVTVDGTDTDGLGITCTGVPNDDTFRMPRLIRNDHDQSGDTFLRPDFAQFLSRFGFLRFMDAGRTNSNAFVKTWANRPTVANGLGMSIEDMVQTCNELGCNMWYCFPFWVTDDYITQAATYIEANLVGWCIYERCNEDWNDGTFPHLAWDLTLCRQEMDAFFHGSYGEAEITGVTAVAGAVTVALNRAPPFANGATAVFKITAGSGGYDTPDAGSVMTVSGNNFTFTNGSTTGTATVTRATIIGNPSSTMYSDNLYLYRELAFRMHGKKTYEMSQLIEAVYGSLNGQARVVLMGWNTNFVPFGIQEDVVFPWLEDQYGAMSDWCYGIGGAPYTNATVGDTTAAQVQTSMYAELSDFEDYFDRVTSLCTTYGLTHVQYEGGPDLTNLAGNHSLIDALYSATEYRETQAEIIDRALSHGVELHCLFYTSMAFPGVDGSKTWGIARSLAADGGAIGSATTSRIRGLDDALLAAPP